ncbi:MAG: peptidylprolyl isomerase, partial [Candidatus Aureabacteria bacterium]|nr:peptidylprolyl isomerase [Candidatus Auribacterota bacterium]
SSPSARTILFDLSQKFFHNPDMSGFTKRQIITAVLSVLLCQFITAAPCLGYSEDYKVVARVNGTPIYQKDLNAGLSKRANNETKRVKIEKLIKIELLKQFLKSENIKVSKKIIKGKIRKIEQRPFTTCSCSHCHSALEKLLKQELLTLKQYGEKLYTDIGLNLYLEDKWRKKYPTKKALDNLVTTNEHKLKNEYAKAYSIYFSIPDDSDDSDEKEAKKKAEAAWQRLQNGERFCAMAKAISEQKDNAEKGGYIGLIKKDTNTTIAKTLFSLKPGNYSKPIKVLKGYFIIKRGNLNYNDMLSHLKEGYIKTEKAKIIKELKAKANIQD